MSTKIDPTVNPFIRLDCGCIGLLIGKPDEYLCLRRCDRDHDEPPLDPYIEKADPEKMETCRTLTEEESRRLIGNLAKLTIMGHRFAELTRTIKFGWPELEDVIQ